MILYGTVCFQWNDACISNTTYLDHFTRTLKNLCRDSVDVISSSKMRELSNRPVSGLYARDVTPTVKQCVPEVIGAKVTLVPVTESANEEVKKKRENPRTFKNISFGINLVKGGEV